MKLYLARHGESDGNVKLLLYGHTDCPLTEKGRAEAELLGEKIRPLEFAHCYASPLSRAAETAKIALKGKNVPLTLCDGFKEQFLGELENVPLRRYIDEDPGRVKELMDNWCGFCPPGGETFPQVTERVWKCAEKIIERNEDALIVAHNGSLSALITRLLGAPMEAIDKFWFNHGCYSLLNIQRGKVKLVCFNK